jgi:hypothetical protein
MKRWDANPKDWQEKIKKIEEPLRFSDGANANEF